jgi:hypothetical protein
MPCDIHVSISSTHTFYSRFTTHASAVVIRQFDHDGHDLKEADEKRVYRLDRSLVEYVEMV